MYNVLRAMLSLLSYNFFSSLKLIINVIQIDTCTAEVHFNLFSETPMVHQIMTM